MGAPAPLIFVAAAVAGILIIQEVTDDSESD
jgi:uncharacterized integral membrane protein